jgi:hypothetical protein
VGSIRSKRRVKSDEPFYYPETEGAVVSTVSGSRASRRGLDRPGDRDGSPRVRRVDGRTFTINGIRKDGNESEPTRVIRCVSRHDFEATPEIADDMKYVHKPTKRKPVREEDEDE